ncbi:hypothetical protein [Hymenobacter sp. BT730]|uniref:hypothetical protein n=1 Tax=Hymenobacter sp. BT730 TaxID=3063332 RepID=UPI0026E0C261|nr:hypothetical protein [Hymenobacter sp. BT730]
MFDSSPVLLKTAPTHQPEAPRSRWAWWQWLALALTTVAVLVAILLLALDPWLRRKAEQEVASRTHGRYQLHIRELRTDLWQGLLEMKGIQLRTRPAVASTLPTLTLDVGRVRVAGVDLWKLLRRQEVPVDSLIIDAVRLESATWPAPKPTAAPLYAHLPARVPGLRLRYVGVQRVKLAYQIAQQDSIRLQRGDFTAHDILISQAGAADTQRIGYAARVALQLAGVQARGAGHRLQIARTQFSSQTRELRVDSVRINPFQPISNQQSRSARLALQLPQLRLTGWRAARLFRQRFQADTLRLTHPEVAVVAPLVAPQALHQLLAPWLKQVSLQSLVVSAGKVRVAGLALAPQVEQLGLQGSDIQIDAASAQKASRVLYARAWQLSSGPGSVAIDAPFYKLRYQGLRLNTAQQRLSITQSKLAPTMSLAALSQRKGHQVSHITMQLPRVQATGLDFAALQHRGVLQVREVVLQRLLLHLAGDGRYPINPKPSLVTPENLRKLPLPLDIGLLKVQNGNLFFVFRALNSPKPSRTSITELNGTIRNINTLVGSRRAAQPAVAQASAWFQRRSFVRATAYVPLLQPNGRHWIKGSFGPAPFSILNSITESSRSLRFSRGSVQRVDFAMTVDQKGVQGTMKAAYSDLKVAFLSQKGGEAHSTLVTKVGSKVANALVIRDNNPRQAKEALKPGTIQSSRNPRVSVFAIWQQGLVSGMLNSIGVPGKLAKKMSEAIPAPETMPAIGKGGQPVESKRVTLESGK